MRRSIPRPLVLIAAVLIVSVPAGVTIAGTYHLTPAQKVEHRHVGDYSVFNAITSNDSVLQTRANNARGQWGQSLNSANPSNSGVPSGLRMSIASTPSGAEIKVARRDLAGTNAVVITETGYHDQDQAEIAFDSTKSSGWSATRKQGEVCRGLGWVVGLDDAGPDRNDCMEDPQQYTDVGDKSIGLVDDFYGPNLDEPSGNMWVNRDALAPNHSYELNVRASGHALTKIQFFLDSEQTPLQTSTNVSTTCSGVAETCINATLSRQGSAIGAGAHVIRVVATNQFGQQFERTVNVFGEHPSTGIMRHYSLESEQLWDRGNAQVNVVNGNLVFEQGDLSLSGTTLNLEINRFYNSQGSGVGDLGPGWSLDTASGIKLTELGNGDVRFFGPSGYVVRFKKNGSSYDTPTGIDAGLTTRSGGGWNLDLYESEERYVFDGLGRFDEHVNQKSDQKIDFVYGAASGKLSEIIDTQERHIDFSYWTSADVTNGVPGAFAGRLRQMADPTGRNWRYFYDSAGRLTSSQLRPSVSGNVVSQTTYGYDSQNRLNAITDPNSASSTGATTRISYDSSGRVTALTRPASSGETDVNADGYIRSFEYSKPNPVPDECLKKSNDPTEEEKDYELTVVTSPRGNETPGVGGDYETTYCHDGKNRVNQVVDAKGNQQNTGWDSKSNVTEYSSGSGATTKYEYTNPSGGSDPARLSRIAEPGGAATSLSYSGSSTTFNPTTVIDPQGNETTYGYENTDNTGNLTSITNKALGKLVELEYFKADAPDSDWKGLLKASTIKRVDLGNGADNEVDERTDYEYYGDGNLKSVVPPGTNVQGKTTYEYDALSRVVAVTDGNGVRRTIAYDALDRPTEITYDGVSTICRITYDPNGNLTRRDDCSSGERSGVVRSDDYTYNLRNLRTYDSLGYRTNPRIAYGYDPDGNLTRLTYDSPNAGTTTFEYDAVNNLIAETALAGQSFARRTTWDYSDDYQPRLITFPNGVRQRFTYRTVPDNGDSDRDGETTEPTQQVRQIEAWTPGKSITTDAPDVLNLIYDYDKGPEYTPGTTNPDDQTALRTRVRDSYNGSTTTTEYEYDSLNRVKTVKENGSAAYSYTYDRASNILRAVENGQAVNYTYNVANELRCSYTGAQLTGCPSGSKSYTYDGDATNAGNGNLRSVAGGTSYSYNTRNHTIGMTPAGQSQEIPFSYSDYSQSLRESRGETEFIDTLLGTQVEWTSSNTLFYDRTSKGQPYGIRRTFDNPAQDSYLLADSLGSVVAMTGGTGSVQARYRYEPYGELASAATGPYNPIRFGGQYQDVATGHYKMGLRYYDPSVGRWTQKDPLNLFQEPRQANRYSYAGGDPVNIVDPTGKSFLDDVARAFDALKLADRAEYFFSCADSLGKGFSGTNPLDTDADPFFGECDPLIPFFGEPDEAR